MESIKGIIERHTIVVLNEALKHGFAQIPRYILRDGKLSFGARLTYAILLSYAWQDESCFPGQERIARDLGVTRKAVNKYLSELKWAKYITWARRGLGKTNIYYILDYQPLKIEPDVTPRLHPDVTTSTHPDVPPDSHKYNQMNKKQKNRISSQKDFLNDQIQIRKYS